MNADRLKDPAKAGVFHLSADAREFARIAAAAGLMVVYVDIGHAHDQEDFVAQASLAMRFPERFAADGHAFAEGLKDLSWMQAKGWAVILEKSKHFCGGHAAEFKRTMELMEKAAAHWRAQGKPFWTLIGGPEGWKSGWPDLPA
ncbi:MAG TPA: barstar family protein [Burkholderiales bacterium]